MLVDEETITLEVQVSDTIRFVKTKIEERTGVYRDHQRLIYNGKVLDDRHTLRDYNIQNGSRVYLGLKEHMKGNHHGTHV